MKVKFKTFLGFILFAGLVYNYGGQSTPLARASGIKAPYANVLFSPEGTCAGYADVPSTHLEYCEALEDLQASGAAGGYSNGFRINELVTRQQFAKMLVVHFNLPLVDAYTTPQHFADVPRTNPFFQWIETAFAYNLMSGQQGDPNFLNKCFSTSQYEVSTKNYFRPCYDITRQQMAKMTAQAAGHQENTAGRTPTFSDMPANVPLFPYVERLVMNQNTWKPYLQPGAPACPSTTKPCYFPTQPVTRLDAAMHIWLAREGLGLGQAFTLKAFSSYNVDGIDAYAETPNAVPVSPQWIAVPVGVATTMSEHYIESGPQKWYDSSGDLVSHPYGSSGNSVAGQGTYFWDTSLFLVPGTRYRYRSYHAGNGVWWSEYENNGTFVRMTTSNNMGTGGFRDATIGAESSTVTQATGRMTVTEAKYHYVNGVWTGFCWDPTHVQRLMFNSYSVVGACYPYPANGLPSYSWSVEYKP